MDVIKVRLQLQNQLKEVSMKNFRSEGSRYRGLFHAGHRIYLEEGYFRGLMKGFARFWISNLSNRITPSLIREFFYSSLRLGLYDPVKNHLAPGKTKEEVTLPQKILAGAISGAIGSAICNPTDLVRSQVIIINFKGEDSLSERDTRNSTRISKYISCILSNLQN